MWLCTRNPLISAAITEKPIIVDICISVHAITISKVSIPMFSWSEISVFVFKSVYEYSYLLNQQMLVFACIL